MLRPFLPDHVVVVLVRARNPQNIGAVARAMHDFGFGRLRVVNEYTVPFEAARSAVDASRVLAAAESFASVGEAVRDCTLVLGTTAVGERVLQHPVEVLSDAGRTIAEHVAASGENVANGARIALIFGSEKTGLSNEELSHCTGLVTIPMHRHEGMRHPSMNLGQAVAVCLYEVVRAGAAEVECGGRERDGVKAVAGGGGITAGATERIVGLLSEVVEKSGYRKHHPANSGEADLRRLVGRMGLSEEDSPVWMGILRQVLWKLGRG